MSVRKVIFKPFKLLHITFRAKSTRKTRLSGSSLSLSYATYQNTNEFKPGPPIVITHGLMGNKGNWNSLSKVISSKGRQVVSIDARNHGESPHTPEMNYFVMGQDIIDLLDELMIDKACLLGHSMGGKMSMVTALKHPERVESLIVVDVSPSISPMVKTYPSYLQCMLKIIGQLNYDQQDLTLSSARKFANIMLHDVEKSPGVRQFLVANLIQTDMKFGWKVNLDSIINNFEHISSFPEFSNICYDGPTLFIGGSESKYISQVDLPEIERLFPNAQVRHVEGSGHWVHSDNPSSFLDTVHAFLDENEKQKHKF